MTNAPALLRVFVYGTLKRGEKNFHAHCHNAVRIEQAWLWGRLFRRHTGTPILSLPAESILAMGSLDASHDVHLQEQANSAAIYHPPTDESHWVQVRGEVIEFTDLYDAMTRLDRLEGFRAAGDDSLYERFLVRLGESPHMPTWTYAIPRWRKEANYDNAPDPTSWSREWLKAN